MTDQTTATERIGAKSRIETPIVDFGPLQTTIEWKRRIPAWSGRAIGDCEIEVRQLFDLDDFGSSEAVDRFREIRVGIKS
jgi:hypothetical protein